jgi:metal-responsive CopG/Arc/MetJ family transcriptional regulator
MQMAEKDRNRIHMRVPEPLLEQVEEYQEKKGITTKTSAFLELVRKGLESDKAQS